MTHTSLSQTDRMSLRMERGANQINYFKGPLEMEKITLNGHFKPKWQTSCVSSGLTSWSFFFFQVDLIDRRSALNFWGWLWLRKKKISSSRYAIKVMVHFLPLFDFLDSAQSFCGSYIGQSWAGWRLEKAQTGKEFVHIFTLWAQPYYTVFYFPLFSAISHSL